MASNRYKMTGCARFFIFLLFIIPIAYFGAKYLDDSGYGSVIKDKFEEISNHNNKDMDTETMDPDVIVNNNSADDITDSNRSKLESKLEQLIRMVDLQKQKIDELELSSAEKDALITKLQNQIKQLGVQSEAPQTTDPAQPKAPGTSLEELLKEADKALKNNN
jgi:uncharacterized coiled-coil protein SlyX